MKKRSIALLAGLMTVGMVSFSADNTFNINDRVRFDENRLEVNGNLHFDQNNNLEIRIRDFNKVGNTFGSETGDGTGKGETTGKTEIRMRLHTQTSVENMEVRTELKTTQKDGAANTQYFRVQPTWNVFNDVEGLSSVVRAGFGTTHTSKSGEDFSFTSSSENTYTINDYFSLEGNAYYDYTFGRNRNKEHAVSLEAYAYANFPLYNANDIKIETLFEGGVDGYNFGSRDMEDLIEVRSKDTRNGSETYVIYAQPSVKVTKTLAENNSVYLQVGYYIETTDANDKKAVSPQTFNGNSDDYNDSAFVRVGFASKF